MADYWLHYVGARSLDRFISETAKYSVQRAIGFNMLKNFDWGQPVLLAYSLRERELGEKPSRHVAARVFGYFTVSGLTCDLPKPIMQELASSLNVIEAKDFGASGLTVNRACGSYSVGAAYYVEDSLQDIVAKAKEICHKHGLDPAAFKWFLTGSLKVFQQPLDIKAPWTRGYVKVQLENLDLAQIQSVPAVLWIKDYEKRTRLSRRAKAALEAQPLTAYT